MNVKIIPRAFTIKYNGLTNRIVTDIGISQAFDPAKPPLPLPQTCNTTALWDTGATASMITEATAKALGLIPSGVIHINHAGGTSLSNSYLTNFYLPNKVCVAGVSVSECPNIAGQFGAIVGMDIISKGDFSITNHNGKTWMTFRVPSIQPADYVIEANRTLYAGTGRNEPCPCGKKDRDGKPIKYKFCHGK